MTLLAPLAPYLYGALRIVAGALFACHGAQKLLGAFGGPVQPIASLLGVAGVIELVGGLLIAVGVLTSVVAFIASGEMAFAYFMVHVPQGTWPILNMGELAVVYCVLFLYIAATGGGKLSLDSVIGSRRR